MNALGSGVTMLPYSQLYVIVFHMGMTFTVTAMWPSSLIQTHCHTQSAHTSH